MNKHDKHESFIISILESINIAYIKIDDSVILEYIYDLYKNNRYSDCNDKIYSNYAGIYAVYIAGDIDLAEKYYLMAINQGNICSMYNLARLYDKRNRNDLAKKYYLMAIEKGYINFMCNFSWLYYLKSKFDISENYYLTAIENDPGNVYYITCLACLYGGQRIYNLAEKYYLMAIEKGHVNSMYNLALLYKDQGKCDLAEKYHLMAIDKGHVDSIVKLAFLYYEQRKYELSNKYYSMGALNHDETSIWKINMVMKRFFDLNNLVKLTDILWDYNRDILNDALKFIENRLIN